MCIRDRNHCCSLYVFILKASECVCLIVASDGADHRYFTMIRQMLFIQLAFVLNSVHSMELILTYKYLDSKWHAHILAMPGHSMVICDKPIGQSNLWQITLFVCSHIQARERYLGSIDYLFHIHHVSKIGPLTHAVISSNLNRFSKLFHHRKNCYISSET